MNSPTPTVLEPTPARVAIREDLLSAPLTDLESVRLLGTRCQNCGETSLGARTTCPNCGKTSVESLALSRRGTLWTYTIVRHKPPGDYHGPNPFVPFAMGLVELPEGIRVLTPIAGDPAAIHIGMALDFHAFVRPGSAAPEVVCFSFNPAH